MNVLQSLGRYGLKLCSHFGRATLFLLAVLWHKPRFIRSLPLLIQQLYAIGVLSLIIIIVSALFIGMVVGLQGYNTLDKFSATQQLGQMVALTVTRE